MDKPFEGVISNWELRDGHIVGMVAAHMDQACAAQSIKTSRCENIYTMNGVRWCETRNSLYVLVP